MIRHEIIALHLATTFKKAEFYPSCSQIKIGGNEKGAPNPDECVTFPGGYSDSDPGIYDPQVFEASTPYVFPGPPVASFVSDTSSSTSGGNSSSTASTTTTSTSITFLIEWASIMYIVISCLISVYLVGGSQVIM